MYFCVQGSVRRHHMCSMHAVLYFEYTLCNNDDIYSIIMITFNLLWSNTLYTVALSLRADLSRYNYQILFRCLLARYFIWMCLTQENDPHIEGFRRYLKLTWENKGCSRKHSTKEMRVWNALSLSETKPLMVLLKLHIWCKAIPR